MDICHTSKSSTVYGPQFLPKNYILSEYICSCLLMLIQQPILASEIATGRWKGIGKPYNLIKKFIRSQRVSHFVEQCYRRIWKRSQHHFTDKQTISTLISRFKRFRRTVIPRPITNSVYVSILIRCLECSFNILEPHDIKITRKSFLVIDEYAGIYCVEWKVSMKNAIICFDESS